MNDMPINTSMLPSRIRFGTKPNQQKSPNVSSLRISLSRLITRTVFAQRANGCMGMDQTAPSMVMQR